MDCTHPVYAVFLPLCWCNHPIPELKLFFISIYIITSDTVRVPAKCNGFGAKKFISHVWEECKFISLGADNLQILWCISTMKPAFMWRNIEVLLFLHLVFESELKKTLVGYVQSSHLMIMLLFNKQMTCAFKCTKWITRKW